MKPVPMLIAAAGLALLTACSGRPSPAAANPGGGTLSTAGTASSPSAVTYSHCIRSHGAAQSACQQLLPAAASSQQQAQQCMQAGVCPQALVQQMLTADRSFARCMRAHGVPNWPDPTVDSEGRPIFNLVPVGITHSQTHSPPISNKLAECGRLAPASVGMESN